MQATLSFIWASILAVWLALKPASIKCGRQPTPIAGVMSSLPAILDKLMGCEAADWEAEHRSYERVHIR